MSINVLFMNVRLCIYGYVCEYVPIAIVKSKNILIFSGNPNVHI